MKNGKTLTFWSALFLAILALGVNGAGAVSGVTLTPGLGPPNAQVSVTGSGFGAYEVVDIFFDTTDLILAVTDGVGAFSKKIKVPRGAEPGEHWITAMGRKSGSAAQGALPVLTNWPQYRFGPRHQGFNPWENVLNRTNVSDLNEAWVYNYGIGSLTGPVVANFLVGGQPLSLAFFGSDDKKLQAINAFTGQYKWGASLGDNPAIPAVNPALKRVFVATDDGKVTSFNAINGGAAKWTATLDTGALSSPTLAYGYLYVTSANGTIYARYQTNGNPLWSKDLKVKSIPPAVANGMVYVVASDNKVYALHFSSGNIVWSAPASDVIVSGPVVANGRVYVVTGVGSTSKLEFFDADTGVGGSLGSQPDLNGDPTVGNGMVYVTNMVGVFAFNLRTGTEAWSANFGGFNRHSALANGVLYTSGSFIATNVTAFSSWNGDDLWSAEAGSTGGSPVVVANGQVYMSAGGRLYAYNQEPGEMSAGAARPRGVPRPDPARLAPDWQLEPE